MTEAEALAVARTAVEARGGELTPRIVVRRQSRWFGFGCSSWQVVSNWPTRGGNWWLTIDDKAGEVRSIGFGPR